MLFSNLSFRQPRRKVAKRPQRVKAFFRDHDCREDSMPEEMQRHRKSKRASPNSARAMKKMKGQALQRPLDALLRLPEGVAG